jgi:hypothetical protein
MDVTRQLADGHGYLGYLVLVAVVAVVIWALVQANRGEAYSEGAPRLVGLLVALQWVYGIITYVSVQGWTGGALLAWVHPLAMTGAVAAAGIATGRAKDVDGVAAWRAIARFDGLALLLIVVGVGAAAA